MSFKSTALAVTTLILSTTANAAIISTDWQVADDNLITQDTSTGLEWLDLTATTRRSYNDVSSKFGAGQEFAGWRYATNAEISGFFDAFGGDSDYYTNWSTQNNGLFDVIAPYWGDTYCAENGCADGDGYSYFTTSALYRDGLQGVGRINDDARDPSLTDTMDSIQIVCCGINKSTASYEIGAALVRVSVVPIPSAVWLFGSGLLSLIGFARRRKA